MINNQEKINEIRQIAESNNGKLISTNWLGRSKKHIFEFSNGQQFETTPLSLKLNGWPKDIEKYFSWKNSRNKTDVNRLFELRKIAEDNNAKLLSKKWIGNKKKYTFELDDKRRFEVVGSYFQKKGWPKDIETFLKLSQGQKKTNKDRLDEIREIAKANNGKLISNEWLGNNKKHIFEFSDGTQFEISPGRLKKGEWPKNIKKFLKFSESFNKTESELLNELDLIAKANNGKLISTQWLGSHKKHLFEFSDGQQFETLPMTLLNNGWPKDIESYFKRSGGLQKTDKEFLNEMRLIAKKNGGKLLSKKWLGARGIYKFIDSRNNEFETTYESLQLGKWYKDRGLVTEPIIRQAFEHLFQCVFKKTRKVLSAKILNRKTSLELDGYNAGLKLAFEYQGHPSHWDISHIKYSEVSQKDLLKRLTCRNLRIILIEIPPIKEGKDKWKEENILNHVMTAIKNKYSQMDISIPALNTDLFQIDYQKINHAYEKLDELKKIAEDNNGKLLSSKYLGSSEKHKFCFKDGREFERRASLMLQYGWPKDPDLYFKISKNNK